MKKKIALVLLLFTMVTMLMSNFGKVNNSILVGGPGDENEDEDIPIDMNCINDKWKA